MQSPSPENARRRSEPGPRPRGGTQEALRESEERFRELADLLPQIVFEADPDGKFGYANKHAFDAFGYTPEEFERGLNMMQMIVPADIPLARTALSRVLAGETTHGQEYTVQRKDSTTFPVIIYSAPMIRDGKVRGLRGIAVDITERKQAEEDLRRSQSLFQICFRSSPAATILSVYADGRCVDANDAYLSLCGYSRDELIGHSTLELGIWHDPEQRKHVISELAQRKRMAGVEILMRMKSGALINTIASGEILRIDGRDHILSFFFDITDRKRAEEERLKLEQRIQQTQKLESLGVLAGGIAHDFNNLLTGIFGFIDLAHAMSKDEEVSQCLNEARTAMDRARALTLQLLTFAKGGAPIRKTEALFPFIKESVNFALSGSNVAASFEIAPDLRLCNFDRNQIGQVIDNIIINAVQAMPMGGTVRISASNVALREMEHGPLAAGNYVRISIADTGVGIPRDMLHRIFDPFFTTKQKGSGLGLATCYSIVNRHGGFIEVESEPGKGSTFHIFLPASDEAPATPDDVNAGPHKGSGRILLMDDDMVVRRAVGAMLQRLGYSCTATHDGDEAMEIFRKAREGGNPFIAIILDLTVPGKMGGKDAALQIRALDRNIPIFVSSGYADDPVLIDPREYGFTDIIRKPFVVSELAAMLARHIKKA